MRGLRRRREGREKGEREEKEGGRGEGAEGGRGGGRVSCTNPPRRMLQRILLCGDVIF